VRRALFVGLVALSSCNDIESRRRSTAPLNASAEFACERYADTPVPPVPRDGRCIVDTSVTYDFTIIVNVPESSFYGASHTFVLTKADLTVIGPDRRAKLPLVGGVIGVYTVKKTVSARVFGPDYYLEDATSIPVRAIYTPVGPDDRSTYSQALPLDVLFASSRVNDLKSNRPRVAYDRSLPAGVWQRSLEPAPPWDEYFPPHVGEYPVQRLGEQFDVVDIGGANGDFDDLGGLSRDKPRSRVRRVSRIGRCSSGMQRADAESRP
jgi:hypothetical protein